MQSFQPYPPAHPIFFARHAQHAVAGRQQAPAQLTKQSACHGSCKPKITPKPAAHQLPNCWQSDNSSSQFGSKRFSALSRLHHLGFLERPRESQTLLWHALLFYAWMSCTAGALPEPALAAATSTTTASAHGHRTKARGGRGGGFKLTKPAG